MATTIRFLYGIINVKIEFCEKYYIKRNEKTIDTICFPAVLFFLCIAKKGNHIPINHQIGRSKYKH